MELPAIRDMPDDFTVDTMDQIDIAGDEVVVS